MSVAFILVTAILNLPARATFAQAPPLSENPLTCRVLSTVRAEKVGGGFFTYTASEPDKATGVVVLVELAYPPTLAAVDSLDFSLRYTGAATEGTAVSSGFDSLPNTNDILDQDITWILYVKSSFKIPLDDPGFDGKAGTEQMRMLFVVPNQADTGTLLCKNRACGDRASIPGRPK